VIRVRGKRARLAGGGEIRGRGGVVEGYFKVPVEEIEDIEAMMMVVGRGGV